MTDRTETHLYTIGSVHVSEVCWFTPLPLSATPHPPGCDSLTHLRYRQDGPETIADVVVSLQPGFTGGASSFDPLARNLVTELATNGIRGEVWAMDRRSQGLTDTTGMRAAVAAKDYRVAIDYYYRGAVVDGKTFAGWVPTSGQRFLAEYGIERVVADWHSVLTRELPDRATRAAKLFVGGHSLGGPLSSFYCQTEFDGDPSTTGGPGYRQVAGVIGLDGPIGGDPFHVAGKRLLEAVVTAVSKVARPAVLALLRKGVVPPSISAGPVPTGELSVLVGIAGLAARFEPTAESELPKAIPHSRLLDAMMRLLFPRGLVRRRPAFRDWRLTNEAVLGSFYARASQPSTIANDMGSYDGAVRRKRASLSRLTRLPMVGDIVGGLITDVVPSMPAAPHTLTGWSDDGALTRLADSALAWGNGLLSYMNPYESYRVGIDLGFAEIGFRGGELARLRHLDYQDHVPHMTVIGDIWRPYQRRGIGQPPDAIHAKGFSHMDIVSATVPNVVLSSVLEFIRTNTPARADVAQPS